MVKCTIHFDNNVNGTFFAGQNVSGHILFYNEKVRNIVALTLTLDGTAETSWSESTGTGDDEKTSSYGSTENYFKYLVYLLGTGNGELSFSSGEHKFNFSFTLPHPLPPSFESFNGTIRYKILVQMQRRIKFNHNFSFPLNVMCELDLNKEFPMLKQHMQSETLKKFSFGRGSVKMEVSIPQSGFVCGQTVRVTVVLISQSSVQISSIIAELRQHCHYKSNFISTKDSYNCLVRTEAPLPKQTDKTKVELRFVVPPAPASLIRHCNIIQIMYYIDVTATVGGLHRNPQIRLPVVIGTNSYDQMVDSASKSHSL